MSDLQDWKYELQSLINAMNQLRVNGRIASFKTQQDRAKYLFKFFNDLREAGFKVSPNNIKLKHIKYICEKYERDKISAATIQTYITHLRVFCRWIGKNGMIKDVGQYFTNPELIKRQYAATELKTWTSKGIDINQKLNEIKQDNIYVWIQLLVQQAFGLRLKEAVCLRPYMSNLDGKLHVLDGTKGGKSRIVQIENEFQKFVIETAIQFVGKTSSSLMDPKLSLKQNLKKYSNTMTKHGLTKKKAGVTGHWLRSEYVIDFMISRGLKPLICGGGMGKLSKVEEREVRLAAAKRLGHNRINVTTAYSGPISKSGLSRLKSSRKNKGNE